MTEKHASLEWKITRGGNEAFFLSQSHPHCIREPAEISKTCLDQETTIQSHLQNHELNKLVLLNHQVLVEIVCSKTNWWPGLAAFWHLLWSYTDSVPFVSDFMACWLYLKRSLRPCYFSHASHSASSWGTTALYCHWSGTWQHPVWLLTLHETKFVFSYILEFLVSFQNLPTSRTQSKHPPTVLNFDLYKRPLSTNLKKQLNIKPF